MNEVWSRVRLDIGWSELIWAFPGVGGRACGHPDDLADADLLVCLSVRSAFDLLLSELSLPAGSEVLMSALTIPHMPAIVRAHDLVPVPLDIDPATMAPGPEAFERSCTSGTRMVVVAHLLGGRCPLGELGSLARRRGVLVVEDCAQAYDRNGCPLDDEADVALYSFGTIKTATSLGGAVARVRDPGLLSTMRAAQDRYPSQQSSEHRRKLAKAAVLKIVSSRPLYGAFVSAAGRNGDLDARLHDTVAGFHDDQLLERIRRRPSPSLVRLLHRRLETTDRERVRRRAELGDQLAAELKAPFEIAGAAVEGSSHWVAPVLVPDPDLVVGELRRSGFDATRWSSMIVVPRPPDHQSAPATGAGSVLDRAVFVPCYPELTDRGHRRLVDTLGALARIARAPPRLPLRTSSSGQTVGLGEDRTTASDRAGGAGVAHCCGRRSPA